MKFEMTKEWCEWAAKLEEGCEVSAGHPSKIVHFLPKKSGTNPPPNNNPSKG